MPELELLQAALGLTPPWRVVGSDFDREVGKLTIHIDFSARQSLLLSYVRAGRLSGLRRRAEALAAPELLAIRNRAQRSLAPDQV